MKKWIVILSVLTITLIGCSEPERVSASEFKQQYSAINKLETMKSAEYLGQKDGKAFIRISTMSMYDSKKWSDKIIYVELSELDTEFIAVLPEKPLSPPNKQNQ